MNQSNRMVQGICSLVLLFCLIGSGLVATQVSAEAGRAAHLHRQRHRG
ncbi:MAG: hypothetical protein ACFHWZ_16555 [Phycisphaerales bacterium]